MVPETDEFGGLFYLNLKVQYMSSQFFPRTQLKASWYFKQFLCMAELRHDTKAFQHDL